MKKLILSALLGLTAAAGAVFTATEPADAFCRFRCGGSNWVTTADQNDYRLFRWYFDPTKWATQLDDGWGWELFYSDGVTQIQGEWQMKATKPLSCGSGTCIQAAFYSGSDLHTANFWLSGGNNFGSKWVLDPNSVTYQAPSNIASIEALHQVDINGNGYLDIPTTNTADQTDHWLVYDGSGVWYSRWQNDFNQPLIKFFYSDGVTPIASSGWYLYAVKPESSPAGQYYASAVFYSTGNLYVQWFYYVAQTNAPGKWIASGSPVQYDWSLLGYFEGQYNTDINGNGVIGS